MISHHLTSCLPKFASIVALTILCLPTLLAQRQPTLNGVVTNAEGHPIEGAIVSEGLSKTVSAKQLDHVTTDKDGRFQLAYPGEVIRVRKETFQPLTLVLNSGSFDITVKLMPEHDNLVARPCSNSPARGSRRIGFGPIGARFDIPKKEVEILGGKWDVDYVRYIVRAKSDGGKLEFWFGPYAVSSEPPDEDFLNSVSFEERYVISSTGEHYGLDVSGIQGDGSRWRRTSIVMTGGGLYDSAQPGDAALFDQIINSICLSQRKD
jgi:hypothetical protein